MQTWFLDIITNPFFLTALSSWAMAQVLKTIIDAIVNRKLDLSRLCGDGGMPSAHSATVTSLAMFIGLRCGVAGFEFALAAIFAIVVCRDAVGVRRETGKQAVLLNEIVRSVELLADRDVLPEVKLKELVGHTPLQVFFGTLLGVANACLMHFAVLPL